MSKQEIQNIIIGYLKTYEPEFVGLFGSFVREDKLVFNDIDILVKFQKGLSLLQIVRIENELSDKVGCKIDLVTEGALKNERVAKNVYKNLKIIYKA